MNLCDRQPMAFLCMVAGIGGAYEVHTVHRLMPYMDLPGEPASGFHDQHRRRRQRRAGDPAVLGAPRVGWRPPCSGPQWHRPVAATASRQCAVLCARVVERVCSLVLARLHAILVSEEKYGGI